MKKLFYLLFVLPLFATAQPSREKFSPLTYTDIIYSSDSALNNDEMYTRIISWVGGSFKNAKAVLDVQNKSAGLIVLKGVIPFSYKSGIKDKAGEVRYTLRVEIKKGRARLHFFNYSAKLADGTTQPLSNDEDQEYKSEGLFHVSLKKAWKTARELVQKDHEDTITTMTASLNKKQDNW